MKKILLLGLIAVFGFLAIQPNTVLAQVPRLMNFSGNLWDNTQTPPVPVNRTDVPLVVEIYDIETGGTAIWADNFQVDVVNGYFTVNLGGNDPLDLDFDVPYWIQIRVDGGNPTERVPLTTSAYAFSAATSETSKFADEVADGSVTQAKLAPGVMAIPMGPAGGDLIGSYPNPEINPDKIIESIEPGSITQDKLAPNVTTPPSGPASGDLTGSYPDPLIAPGAVKTDRLADGAVISQKIANGTILTQNIAENQINDFVIQNTDDFNFNSVNTATSATIGTDLTVNGMSVLNGSSTINNTLVTNGSSTFNNNVLVTGNQTTNGMLTVDGTSTMNDMLTITANGANVTGDVMLNNNLMVTGSSTLTGDLQVDGTSIMNDMLTITANGANVTGDVMLNNNLMVTGSSTLTGDLQVDGTSTMNDMLTITANGANVTGDVMLNNDLMVGGASTFTGALTANNGVAVTNGLTADQATITNGTVTAIDGTDLTYVNGTFTDLVSTNFTVTNLTVTNLTNGTFSNNLTVGNDLSVGGNISGQLTNNLTAGDGIDAFTYDNTGNATVGIANGGVTNIKLANDAVDEPKIGASNAATAGFVLGYNGANLEWVPGSVETEGVITGDGTAADRIRLTDVGVAGNQVVIRNPANTDWVFSNINGGVIEDGSITNDDISPTAAIAYSKLNLANSIVNADVAPAAAIAYSKLNLTNSIITGDLTNESVTDDKISSAGAGGAGEVLISDGAGGVTWGLVNNIPANNGLTNNSGTIQLGGNLINNTDINTDNGNLEISGTGEVVLSNGGGVYVDRQITMGNTGDGFPADVVVDGGTMNLNGTALTLTTGNASLTSGNLSVGGTTTLNGATTVNNTLSQTGAGNQVTFAGNVDATNGLDVTGANLTVGTEFNVNVTNGNITTTGSTNLGNATASDLLDVRSRIINDEAGQPVSVIDDLDVTGGLDVDLNYTSTNGNITLSNGNITATNGSLTVGSAVTVGGNYTSTNGNITLTNGNITATNGNLTVGGISTFSGQMNANGGIRNNETSGTLTLADNDGISLTSTSGIALTGPVTASSTLAVTGNATFAGNVTLGNAAGDAITSTGAFTASNGATVNGSTLAANAGLTANAATLTTADINGGTIDGSTINGSSIGLTTAAAGAFTNLTAAAATLTTADINGGTIDGVNIGNTTAGNATFTTVDINGGNIDGTTIGNTTAAGATFTTLNATNNTTLANMTSTAATLTTADINGGTIDGSTINGSSIGLTTAAAGAFTNLTAAAATLTTADINGGTIDGVNIGNTTAGNATFTTVDINGGNIDGTTIGNATASAASFTTSTSEMVRISNTDDAAVGSTNHGLQIGATTGANLIMDNNEIIARNNGALARLFLNGEDDSETVIGNNILNVMDDKVGVNTLTPSATLTVNGTASVSGLTTLANMTSTAATLTTADINGGTIDGATIGNGTAAAATFTSVNISGGNLTGMTNISSTNGTFTNLNNTTIGNTSAAAASFTTINGNTVPTGSGTFLTTANAVANNGLSFTSGSFQLGGSLTAATTLINNGNPLTIRGNDNGNVDNLFASNGKVQFKNGLELYPNTNLNGSIPLDITINSASHTTALINMKDVANSVDYAETHVIDGSGLKRSFGFYLNNTSPSLQTQNFGPAFNQINILNGDLRVADDVLLKLSAQHMDNNGDPDPSFGNALGTVLEIGTQEAMTSKFTAIKVSQGKTVWSVATATSADLSAFGYATIIKVTTAGGAVTMPTDAVDGQIIYILNESGSDLTGLDGGNIVTTQSRAFVYYGTWISIIN